MIEAVLKGSDPDASKRECFDCRHCKAAVSWWCKNEDARKYHGTGIPQFSDCKFWEPINTYEKLGWWTRNFGNFIVIERKL
jgi:hypothetical protein